MTTITDQITRLETQVFQRKYAAGQKTELALALERDGVLPADVAAVVNDYLWERRPGQPMPSPKEFRDRCLTEKHHRKRREERRTDKRGQDGLLGVVEDLEERGGSNSYNCRVYAKAFGMLFKSRRLHILEAHREAVRKAIEIVGPPRDDDAIRELDDSTCERLTHLRRVINEEVAAAIDFDPFVESDAVQT